MASNEFAGKVILVTGAGKGTGRRLAEMFARRGATVAVNDLTPINLDETGRAAFLLVFRMIMLLVMSIVGSVIANRGIKLYAAGRGPAPTPKRDENAA